MTSVFGSLLCPEGAKQTCVAAVEKKDRNQHFAVGLARIHMARNELKKLSHSTADRQQIAAVGDGLCGCQIDAVLGGRRRKLTTAIVMPLMKSVNFTTISLTL